MPVLEKCLPVLGALDLGIENVLSPETFNPLSSYHGPGTATIAGGQIADTLGVTPQD